MRISVSSILGVHSGLRLNNWDSGSEVQYSGFILGIQGLTCRVKMQQFGNQWVPSFDFRSLGSEKGGSVAEFVDFVARGKSVKGQIVGCEFQNWGGIAGV